MLGEHGAPQDCDHVFSSALHIKLLGTVTDTETQFQCSYPAGYGNVATETEEAENSLTLFNALLQSVGASTIAPLSGSVDSFFSIHTVSPVSSDEREDVLTLNAPSAVTVDPTTGLSIGHDIAVRLPPNQRVVLTVQALSEAERLCRDSVLGGIANCRGVVYSVDARCGWSALSAGASADLRVPLKVAAKTLGGGCANGQRLCHDCSKWLFTDDDVRVVQYVFLAVFGVLGIAAVWTQVSSLLRVAIAGIGLVGIWAIIVQLYVDFGKDAFFYCIGRVSDADRGGFAAVSSFSLLYGFFLIFVTAFQSPPREGESRSACSALCSCVVSCLLCDPKICKDYRRSTLRRVLAALVSNGISCLSVHEEKDTPRRFAKLVNSAVVAVLTVYYWILYYNSQISGLVLATLLVLILVNCLTVVSLEGRRFSGVVA